MTIADTNTLMTAEELLAKAGELGRCELIEGELVMMSPAGGTHGELVYEISFQVGSFVKEHQLGKLYTAETGFRLQTNPDTVRAPDIAFIATDRAAAADTDSFIPIAPDLAVEVNSPSDTASHVAAKVQWWLAHGTREVWVVDPKAQTITTYLPDGAAHVYQRADTLTPGAVLPGFELPLADVFKS